MAAGGSENNDGSDIFWPGYVDATTNLILNLLFLLTILIVAVFMFALELGRAVGPQDANADGTVVAEEATDPLQENIALKSEIQRLKKLLEEQGHELPKAAAVRTVEATSTAETAQAGLDNAFASGFELMVRFNKEAVSFTPDERARLLKELKPVTDSEKTLIRVDVPLGFSEAKRMGFYRALAVRNLLVEMKIPTENIDVSVVEGGPDANAAVVRVRAK